MASGTGGEDALEPEGAASADQGLAGVVYPRHLARWAHGVKPGTRPFHGLVSSAVKLQQ